MDQKQRRLLESAAQNLASEIDFLPVAELLQLSKLISKDKIEEIVVSYKI